MAAIKQRAYPGGSVVVDTLPVLLVTDGILWLRAAIGLAVALLGNRRGWH